MQLVVPLSQDGLSLCRMHLSSHRTLYHGLGMCPWRLLHLLIGKRTLRSSRASCFSSSNFGANSVIISSNPFLSMWPRFVLAISAYDQRHQILPAYAQDGIILACVFQGSTDTAVFEDFIEQLLPRSHWPRRYKDSIAPVKAGNITNFTGVICTPTKTRTSG